MTVRAYEVFGGVLRSELSISDLPESSSSSPDWTLRIAGSDWSAPAGEELGSDLVFGDTRVRGYRTVDGFGLVFDDTGRFDVSADGSVITWFRPPDAMVESAQADVTSRVLALAMHAAGLFTLHASAVSIQGAGIAFLAPKYHGKSTLCSAMVKAGAKALSDDTVPVRPDRSPMLSPGLPRIRLWSDSASRLFSIGDDDTVPRKHLLATLDPSQVETRTIPFEAAYVLSPVGEFDDGVAAKRQRLDAVDATMSLVMHAKLGPVLTGTESPVVLTRAAEIARAVPVYALHVVRDLNRLDDVARLLVSWHTGTGEPRRGGA